MSVNELIDTYQKEIKDINELKSQKYVDDKCLETAVSWIERFVEDLEGLSNLEYNRKVKIPKFVADWIKSAKYEGEWPGIFFDDACISPEIQQWNSSNKNCENFMSAWTNGYEVEEEPKYYIKLPDIGYLKLGNWRYFYSSEVDEATSYTEKEIKQQEERYWPFAVPVEEVNNG